VYALLAARLRGSCLYEHANLSSKVIGAFEPLVDRGKSNVRNIINFAKCLKRCHTDLFTRDITVEKSHVFFNGNYESLESLFVDGAVLARRSNAAQNLLFVKRLFFTRAFHDKKAYFFDSFIGCETLRTGRAFSAASDGNTVFR